MPHEYRDDASLWDMLDAAQNVLRFVTNRTLDQYKNDLLLKSAVERQVEIIGEAARRVTAEFRTAHSEIPWRLVMAQRNVLAHDYGEIDPEKIWRVATIHVPALIVLLTPLVPPFAES